jgi:L-fucose mutarotase/ribose pyranase (RbsD/FucU family)
MAVEPGDTYKPPTWLYYDRILEQRSGLQIRKKMLPKKEFYPRAKCAYAVVVTGEPTFYATIMLRKGTVVW